MHETGVVSDRKSTMLPGVEGTLSKEAVEVIPFVESETPVNAVVSINAAQHATERYPHNASSSKSSNLSRYFMMLRLILEESTQVTKSSMFLAIVNPCCSEFAGVAHLVTRYAGSVMTSVPTLT